MKGSHGMTSESLADAIRRAGGVIPLLRNSPIRPHTFPVTPEYTNWRTEQRAWRDGCALLDQSHHMTDLYLQGPDAADVLSSLGINSFANFSVGKAKQYVAVNSCGRVIGDAVLFHLEDELFDLVGHPMVHDWVQFHIERDGRNVRTERDDNSFDRVSGPPKTYRYEVQGPTALDVLEKAAGAVPATKFFNMADFEIGGRRVRGLRHGMAGQPGFELFGPWDQRNEVLDALLAAGEGLNLVRCGAKAYSTANLESGWVPAPFPAIYSDEEVSLAYREWLPAKSMGSLAGSIDSDDVTDYYTTPYDLGYGKMVAFDHDFVGRDALELLSERPPRSKVTLVWDRDDVADAVGSMYQPGLGAKYIEMPKARYALHQADQVLVNGQPCGISMDCGYISNERSMISLATIDVEQSEPGTEVTVVWGESPNSTKPQVEAHGQREIRAVVAPAPYIQFARQAYRGQ
jgi:vanillate/3-O-methylgallate O-demethylase